MSTSIGKPAPVFQGVATSDKAFDLNSLKGKNVVLYFYPRDSTPGCTTESIDFSDQHPQFSKLNCEIIGVSRDTLTSHEKFKDKYSLPFELISDADETICNQYAVMRIKNMYGKKVRGIERSTFLIDAQGNLVKEWRKVTVDGHVADVLASLNQLA